MKLWDNMRKHLRKHWLYPILYIFKRKIHQVSLPLSNSGFDSAENNPLVEGELGSDLNPAMPSLFILRSELHKNYDYKVGAAAMLCIFYNSIFTYI